MSETPEEAEVRLTPGKAARIAFFSLAVIAMSCVMCAVVQVEIVKILGW